MPRLAGQHAARMTSSAPREGCDAAGAPAAVAAASARLPGSGRAGAVAGAVRALRGSALAGASGAASAGRAGKANAVFQAFDLASDGRRALVGRCVRSRHRRAGCREPQRDLRCLAVDRMSASMRSFSRPGAEPASRSPRCGFRRSSEAWPIAESFDVLDR